MPSASRAWTLDSIPDQSGRLAVVTGANSGIGQVTAEALARRGAHVVLACRSPQRGRPPWIGCSPRHPAPTPRCASSTWPILPPYAPSPTAGTMTGSICWSTTPHVAMVPFARTADGFESQFGINHLGTFALTGLMLPHLLASPDPLVVTVSSEGQRFARFDPDNLNAERRYRTVFAYLQSKRANLYFATELQRRADAAGLKLRSMAVAPGLTRTNVLTGGANGNRGRLYGALTRLLVRVAFRPTPEGAKTSLYAATVPDLPGGAYVVPDGPLQLRGEPVLRNRERAIRDTTTARQLWELSEKLTCVPFRLTDDATCTACPRVLDE